MSAGSHSALIAIVLAAGRGTRMKSGRAKAMVPLAGIPLAGYALECAARAGSGQIALVVGPDMAELEAFAHAFAQDRQIAIESHVQDVPRGTGDAVRAASSAFCEDNAPPDAHVLVLFADTPGLRAPTIAKMRTCLDDGADIVVTGFASATPGGYGRLQFDAQDRLVGIIEARDAARHDRRDARTPLLNGGVMAFRAGALRTILPMIDNRNAAGEFYLTRAIACAAQSGLDARAIEVPHSEVSGVNTPAELASVESDMQARWRADHLENGVIMRAPETVYFCADTRIGPGTYIEPFVVFGPGVTIGTHARIGAFSHIEGARIGGHCRVGPHARLRPGAALEPGAKVGNFVEVKNSQIGTGSKVNHISYIGDTQIGAGSNIGAGTITCNYDGQKKSPTQIGDAVFVGSNTTLVAPLAVGPGAYIAAGSVMTADVPEDALAFGRARQTIKPGRAANMERGARDAGRKKQGPQHPKRG